MEQDLTSQLSDWLRDTDWLWWTQWHWRLVRAKIQTPLVQCFPDLDEGVKNPAQPGLQPPPQDHVLHTQRGRCSQEAPGTGETESAQPRGRGEGGGSCRRSLRTREEVFPAPSPAAACRLLGATAESPRHGCSSPLSILHTPSAGIHVPLCPDCSSSAFPSACQ